MKIFFLCMAAFLFHGEDVATYTITKNNNTLYITANLDASDVAKALDSDINSVEKSDLELYLNTHTAYRINGQLAHFAVNRFKVQRNHLLINLSFSEEFETINELQIKNTSLFEVNPKQSNVIEIRFDGMVRDFLINEQKPILTITF